MPVKRLPYASVDALLAREALAEEDPGTRALIAELRHVKKRGEFSRAEFLRMSRWKSPRAAPHYARNTAARIRRVSRAVLATRSESRRIELLTGLRGVSIPVASAILTLIDPKRYGVLDIRVWQLLHALGAVSETRVAAGSIPPTGFASSRASAVSRLVWASPSASWSTRSFTATGDSRSGDSTIAYRSADADRAVVTAENRAPV